MTLAKALGPGRGNEQQLHSPGLISGGCWPFILSGVGNTELLGPAAFSEQMGHSPIESWHLQLTGPEWCPLQRLRTHLGRPPWSCQWPLSLAKNSQVPIFSLILTFTALGRTLSTMQHMLLSSIEKSDAVLAWNSLGPSSGCTVRTMLSLQDSV